MMMLEDKREEKRKPKSAMSPFAIFMLIFVVVAITGTIAATLFFPELYVTVFAGRNICCGQY